MDKFRFRVVGIDIDHDLKRYPEGSTIELTLEAASVSRRWLELLGRVEKENDDDLQPPAPVVIEPAAPVIHPPVVVIPETTGSENGADGEASSASAEEQAEATGQAEPAVSEAAAADADKPAAKPAASKPANKGASK